MQNNGQHQLSVAVAGRGADSLALASGVLAVFGRDVGAALRTGVRASAGGR